MSPVEISEGCPMESFLQQAVGPDFKIYALAGDASNRRYYRVVREKSSWVLMVCDAFENADQFPFLNIQKHWSRLKIHVPTVYSFEPREGLILLEDLGDLTLERKFWERQDGQESLTFYRQAIEELIKVHYQVDTNKEARENCVAFQIEFDRSRFMWELDFTLKNLVVDFAEIELSEIEEKEIKRCFSEIVEKLVNEPKRLCHRDYHSRNLMIHLGQIYVIDFQDARLGPVQYDLVSLLRDSYVDIRPSMMHELIGFYLDCRSQVIKSNSGFSHENFMNVFEVQTIQRCFKACGSFASFYNQRGDSRYLKYLQPTLATVKESLKGSSQWQPLLKILDNRGLFSRHFEAEKCQP